MAMKTAELCGPGSGHVRELAFLFSVFVDGRRHNVMFSCGRVLRSSITLCV